MYEEEGKKKQLNNKNAHRDGSSLKPFIMEIHCLHKKGENDIYSVGLQFEGVSE